ncbi:hypothetical protein [Pseudochryseolinea flava]|uniref:Uncharacterized protein n=1 Tax=Pseudochryseolinea flava TaxID=2059302 RepID=A0A364Y6V6_9BACT|nr:hypothetical protein [Pseudochryseolinea flava]RAW01574.1 hypothetical protein DQQ10_07905 [Pseudochryseolinea flava]
MKSVYVIIILLSIVGVSATLLIANHSATEEKVYDFKRQPMEMVEELEGIDLGFDSYYIIGVAGEKMYLGNTQSPFVVTQLSLTEPCHMRSIKLTLPDSTRLFKRSIRIRMIDSTLFFMEGRTPRVYFTRSLASDTVMLERFASDELYFFNALPVSDASIFLQGVSHSPYTNILGKESHYNCSAIIADSILEKQVDGLFCTSGMLHYNQALNLAVYLYSHRNEYILLDTNLSIMGKGNTIDTFTVARVRSVYVESDRERKLVSPNSQINLYSFVAGTSLFVVSGLLTRYDNFDKALRSSVIDVYDISSQTYCYTFYLPDFEGQRFSSIMVSGNKLYAIYRKKLRVFRLLQPF